MSNGRFGMSVRLEIPAAVNITFTVICDTDQFDRPYQLLGGTCSLYLQDRIWRNSSDTLAPVFQSTMPHVRGEALYFWFVNSLTVKFIYVTRKFS